MKNSMQKIRRSIAVIGLTTLGMGGLAASASAQSGSTHTGSTPAMATTQPDEFHVGDRIAISVEGPTSLADTLVVREGLILRLPNMGDVSLKGVTRSNANQYLTGEVGKYLKNAVVRVTPLVQIGVLGAVAGPGYYSVPSDMVLSDLLMRAGGPVAGAEVNKSVILRGSATVMGEKAVSQALASAKTVDDLRLANNDQLVVKEKSPGSVDSALRVSGVVIGLVGLLVALKR